MGETHTAQDASPASVMPLGLAAKPTAAAKKRRATSRVELIAKLKGLLAAAHQALGDGALSADEYEELNRLQLWLGRLLAEQDASSK